MTIARASLTLLVLLGFAVTGFGEDAAAKEKKKNEAELVKIDAQIKKTPDDPAPHHRRAQVLMKLERWDDGYAAAQKSMECSIKKQDALASLLLETIDIGAFRVEVLFNMGSRERKPPDMGIVRPLTFRILKAADKAVKDSKDEFVEVIDFELGYMGGTPGTAAFGQMEGKTHKNMGMQKVDMAYKDIRANAIELIKRRHAPEKPADPPADPPK